MLPVNATRNDATPQLTQCFHTAKHYIKKNSNDNLLYIDIKQFSQFFFG